MKKLVTLLAVVSILSGCASAQFSVLGNNEYAFSKLSDACAVGSPTSLLNNLRAEAIKFCAARNESPIEISSSTEMGIPAIRCTSGILRFKCAATPDGSIK